MLRKVKILTSGDTHLVARTDLRPIRFPQGERSDLSESVKVTQPGDSDFVKNQDRSQNRFTSKKPTPRLRLLEGKSPAKSTKPKQATCEYPAVGYYQGSCSKFEFHLGRQFPRDNDQGSDRSGFGWQDRQFGWLEGKCNPGTLDPGWNRFPDFPGF